MNDSHPSFIHPGNLWRDLGLSAGQTIVHLGSGPGFYLIPAAHIVGPSGKAIGIDIQRHLLEETESRANRDQVSEIVHTIRADLEQIEGSTLPAGSADWVLVANILHQSDPVKILTEARRLVKPDGRIVVIDWDTVATPIGPPPEVRISRQRVEQMADALELERVTTVDPSSYHYGYIFELKDSNSQAVAATKQKQADELL